MSSLPSRFWVKVEKSPTCWLWTGAKTPQGYGSIRIASQAKAAHRLAYEDACGPVPSGLVVHHICRVRACVNPAHLQAVTQRENILAGSGISATCASLDRCPQGHAYDSRNTRVTKHGGRVCVACFKAYQRKYYVRHRTALIARSAAYKRAKRENAQ